MHGPTGQLFFWGIVVGCVAMLGLVLILAGLRGGVKRRDTARRNATWRKRSERESAPAADPSAADAPAAEPPTPELVAAVPPAVPETEAESVRADQTADKVGS